MNLEFRIFVDGIPFLAGCRFLNTWRQIRIERKTRNDSCRRPKHRQGDFFHKFTLRARDGMMPGKREATSNANTVAPNPNMAHCAAPFKVSGSIVLPLKTNFKSQPHQSRLPKNPLRFFGAFLVPYSVTR
jgi:hypothetical protein